jgi:ABC-type phosphate/phosphonate transport system substrate-binding protein
MILRQTSSWRLPAGMFGIWTLLLCVALAAATSRGQDAPSNVLRIGTSGTLSAEAAAKEKSNLQTLRSFIKDETGFQSEITRQKDWRELADKMAKKQLQLGVFQGYEFAWAQAKYPQLKPLALALNVYTYPIAYVVAKRDNPAKDFAGLKGQSFSLPSAGQHFLRLFVDRQAQANGKDIKDFFGKVTTADNVEDALDDVVDGVTKATAADRAALEAYKRRKPGRFKQLKEVAKSPPVPPALVAYYDAVLDEATLTRFRDGLLRAGKTDRGQTMLTLFRLTGFVTPPEDFAKVLAQTRKTYPAEAAGK